LGDEDEDALLKENFDDDDGIGVGDEGMITAGGFIILSFVEEAPAGDGVIEEGEGKNVISSVEDASFIVGADVDLEDNFVL
jgi:Fe-S cluster assembly iron-binding protein IscA